MGKSLSDRGRSRLSMPDRAGRPAANRFGVSISSVRSRRGGNRPARVLEKEAPHDALRGQAGEARASYPTQVERRGMLGWASGRIRPCQGPWQGHRQGAGEAEGGKFARRRPCAAVHRHPAGNPVPPTAGAAILLHGRDSMGRRLSLRQSSISSSISIPAFRHSNLTPPRPIAP